MESLNIGIIGAGYIGREHARSLRLVRPIFEGKVNLVAIADKNLEVAQHAARDFEIGYATDDVNKVIEDPNVNVIFSCVPTKFHKDIVKRAAELGKAVFLEKPFAISVEEAEEVKALLEKIPHQVGFVLRYAPTYHAMKKLMDSQDSPLRSVILRDDQKFPISGLQHYTEWRSQAELAGAGVLIEHGIHDVDLFEFLFGKIKRVSAIKKNFAGYEGIEDYIEIRMEFESGVNANMVHIWHDIPAHTSIRHFELFYQKALISADTYDMHRITVRGQDSEAIHERPDLYRMIKDAPLYKDISDREDLVFQSDYYALQDYWFCRNLLEGNPLSPSIDDGLRAFKIAHACYQSADQDGAWVSVEGL